MKKSLIGLLFILATSIASAQNDYPTRAIRLIVPFPVGQTADLIARILTQKLTDSLGQTVWVDNKPGAAGILGMEAAKGQAPDGYTLLFATSGPMAINESLYKNLPYRTLRDFTPTIHERLIKLGAEPVTLSPADTQDYIAKGITLWAAAVKVSGATAD